MATSQYHRLYNNLLEAGKTELIQPLNNALLNFPNQYQVLEHTDYKLKFSTAGQVYYARLKFNPKTLIDNYQGLFEVYLIPDHNEPEQIKVAVDGSFDQHGVLEFGEFPPMDFDSFFNLFPKFIFNAWFNNNITVYP